MIIDIVKVILPAIDSVQKLYDDGKIGTAERNLLRTTILVVSS